MTVPDNPGSTEQNITHREALGAFVRMARQNPGIAPESDEMLRLFNVYLSIPMAESNGLINMHDRAHEMPCDHQHYPPMRYE